MCDVAKIWLDGVRADTASHAHLFDWRLTTDERRITTTRRRRTAWHEPVAVESAHCGRVRSAGIKGWWWSCGVIWTAVEKRPPQKCLNGSWSLFFVLGYTRHSSLTPEVVKFCRITGAWTEMLKKCVWCRFYDKILVPKSKP